jgi:hypothetical protein
MEIRNLFSKPIDRDIEGVVKVDDLESLKIEVDEYVITNEIATKLNFLFQDFYNKSNQSNNGVWISGFFGSGKSHLLKMLALLLENQHINGMSVLDAFLAKIPESDAFLRAEIKKAAAIPAQSILFNIDQKANTISKGEFDAVLSVFAMVFDEFCGYYGKHGYIAKFERDLDHQGLFEKFKENYKKVAGKSWHEGRERYNMNRRKIAKAFALTNGDPEDSALDIILSYREDYKLSIADFANNVNDYIQRQEAGFRLNFFVDEVGQYIAENVKLMTNLQTIAESLATICGGRAWLFVTSQDDMTTVLGDFGKHQSNDFSKIQGRFECKIHLSSQDVAEVIQKRLLAKNDRGEQQATTLYDREHQNFGTLFKFPDGGVSFRGFRDQQEFVQSYPFIPYQYTLFQQAIEELSRHNAFTGKHNSVGERSMLGVFQDVVIGIAGQPMGTLGSFDLMFEGIRSSLKSRSQSAIFRAEEHLNDPFAVKVLKALFLVKYVKGFRATVRNLRVLLQTRFDEDIRALENRIQSALDVLENQTYIQRNEDEYEYLTEDEHDIEVEIKNVSVEHEAILKTLEDIFFSEIIRDSKIRYQGNDQDYAFAKMIDEKLRGRDHELHIDFITPFHDFSGDLTALKAHAMGKAVMTVVLPSDPKFQQDVMLYKKTETYIKQNPSTQVSDSKDMILAAKSNQNLQRKRAISSRAQELVGAADFIVSGDSVEIGGEDARSRIVKGFNALIDKVYPNLRMLGGVQYSENQIRHYLDAGKNSLLGSDAVPMNEDEMAVITYIQNNKARGESTTMKKVEDQFSSRPYGWYLAALQCVVAQLAGRGKIECWLDGNLLEPEAIEKALKNTYGFSNLTLEPVKSVDPQIIFNLKQFYGDFFNEPAVENEARPLIRHIREQVEALKADLEGYYRYHQNYPFLSRLMPIITLLEKLLARDLPYFTNEFMEEREAWLDLKEEEIDPLINFMKGQKREIYDHLVHFINTHRPDLSSEDIRMLEGFLNDPQIYMGSRLQQARSKMESVEKKLEANLAEVRKSALAKIDSLQDSLHQMDDFQQLDGESRASMDRAYEAMRRTIQDQDLAVSIRDKMQGYEVEDHPRLLTEASQKASGGGEAAEGDAPSEPAPTFIHRKNLQVAVEKQILETEDDVRAYLQALEAAMLDALRDNKRIQL